MSSSGDRRIRIMVVVAAGLACLVTSVPHWAIAANETRVSGELSAIPSTKVACLIKGSHRYSGKSEPNGRCDIGGQVESSFDLFHGSWERLGKGGTFVRFPLKARPFNGSAWTDWGARKSRGIAESLRNGDHLNLSVYRRIRCADGSTWYSKADVSDTQTAVVYYMRLPVCGDSVPRGQFGTR